MLKIWYWATTQGCPYTHACSSAYKKCPLSNGFLKFINFKTLKINALLFWHALCAGTLNQRTNGHAAQLPQNCLEKPPEKQNL